MNSRAAGENVLRTNGDNGAGGSSMGLFSEMKILIVDNSRYRAMATQPSAACRVNADGPGPGVKSATACSSVS
jgi:hypothetical protein